MNMGSNPDILTAEAVLPSVRQKAAVRHTASCRGWLCLSLALSSLFGMLSMRLVPISEAVTWFTEHGECCKGSESDLESLVFVYIFPLV